MPNKNVELNWEDCYEVEGSLLKAFHDIMKRLYNDKPITPDERRDMANRMDAVFYYVKINL
jgi:hypothetical protein